MLFNFRLRVSKWFLLLPVTILGSLIAGCLFYLTSSYERLTTWYLGLYPCIYKHATWTDKFFTPAVNQSGRNYCLVGIAVSVLLIVALIYALRKKKGPFQINLYLLKADSIYLGALFLFALLIWIYGYTHSYPAYDEVFSAVNCASIHPFQTASYYMLPNNHVFFNLLNGILFHWAPNKVITGRIISGAALIVLIPLLYYWLQGITKSKPYSALFCAIMLLQFPVWAFSFQARGYAIYLVCAWAAFISLQHVIETNDRKQLVYHGLATTIAFITVPSYLYWELAIIAYALIYMVIKRRIYWSLILTQVISGSLIFLFFLPVLCFSGLASMTQNAYVKAIKIVSVTEYWKDFKPAFESAIQYCFSGWVDAHNWSYRIMFFLPLVLLPFIRNRRAAPVVLFYILVWLAFIVVLFKTQRYPFMRNFIAHDSITLAALLMSCYAVVQMILPKFIRLERIKMVKAGIIGLAAFGLSAHFVRFNRDHLHDCTYFYDVKFGYEVLQDALNTIPAGSKVGLANEGFYWEFICHNRGLQASMCFGEDADYYVRQKDEDPVPAYLIDRVEPWKEAGQYEILKIKPKLP